MKRFLIITPLILTLILLAVLAFKLVTIGDVAQSPMIGRPLPQFSLPSLELCLNSCDKNKTKKTANNKNRQMPPSKLPHGTEDVVTPELFSNADIKGKYALLNVFASWCLTCKVEHPVLMQIKEDNKIAVYGINWRDDAAKVNEWFKNSGNPYEKIADDKNGELVIALGVTGAPETFLISPDGIVIFRYAGAITEEIYNDEILPLVK